MRLGLGLSADSITSQKVGSGFTGLLDTYTGAVSAYSVRRVSGSYNGSSIKVRRSSDDALQDIGFDSNGNLDTTALLAFVGTGGSDNGFVTTLYDQTGNNDLANGSASQQPKIVEAGSVTTIGGETALKFNDAEFLQKTSATTNWVADSNLSIFSVFSVTDYTAAVDADRQVLYNISGDEVASAKGDTVVAMVRSDQLRIGFRDEAGGTFTKKAGFQSPADNTQTLVSSIYDSSSTLTSTMNASTNGTVTGNPDGNRANNTFTIGALHNGAKTLTGFIQELVIWNSDQTSNRDNIAGDMNTYFDIYS